MTYRFQAELKADHLRAMSHLAAQKDIRYYLQGVMVFALPDVLLGATTGIVLGVLRTGQVASARFQIRIPNTVLKQMGNAKGVVLLGSDDGENWVLKVGPATLGWKAEEERYPELHRALPATVSGAAAKLDGRRLSLFYKTADALGARDEHAVLVGHNGPDTALVSMPAVPDFIGGIAPLRSSPKHPEPAMVAPLWAKEPPAIPDNWRKAPAAETCDLA